MSPALSFGIRYFGLKSETAFTTSTPPPTHGDIVPGFSLEDYLADKKSVWDRIAAQHDLDPGAWEYATWPFLQFVLSRTWPDESTLDKSLTFGWDKTCDTWQTYEDGFKEMKVLKLMP